MGKGKGGQGNKGRKPGSGNKGYGPGSGRGFKGAGIGGNVGGFGKGNSPSGNNKSGQGGNNPFGKKGFSDKGQVNFTGLANFFSNMFTGKAYADAMGEFTGKQTLKSPPSQWKINQFLKHNIDIANPQPGLKINIDTARAIEGMEDGWKKTWLKKWTPQAIKNLKINHQMFYSPKIKVGDPRYTPQGTGSPKPDPKAEEYLKWMAKQNPTGMTVSEAKKIYANNLKDGKHTLQQVMKMNPANTISFYALIDDTKKAEEKALDTQYKNDQAIYNNNKKNMSVTISPSTGSGSGPQQQTDKEWLKQAYKDTFGRDASFGTKGGANYWLDQMKSNPTTHSKDEVLRMLKGSDEGKKFAASKTTANPGGTPLPGGVDPKFSLSSQAGPGTWASHFTPGGVFANEDGASAIKAIAKDIGFGTKASDGTVTTPNYFNAGVTDQTNADKTGTTIPPSVSDGWWTKFADADAFKKFLTGDNTDTDKADDGMGDFMKFMMLMSVMRPGGGGFGGGGYGGSQFGYGGLNPGGVQAAYDPMKSLQGMGTWFKDNFGTKTPKATTTATVNAT